MEPNIIEIIKEVGILIRTARKNKKLTISSLSYMTGIHRNTISKIENGIYDCQLSKYLTIFAALKLDTQEISRLISSLYNLKNIKN